MHEDINKNRFGGGGSNNNNNLMVTFTLNQLIINYNVCPLIGLSASKRGCAILFSAHHRVCQARGLSLILPQQQQQLRTGLRRWGPPGRPCAPCHHHGRHLPEVIGHLGHQDLDLNFSVGHFPRRQQRHFQRRRIRFAALAGLECLLPDQHAFQGTLQHPRPQSAPTSPSPLQQSSRRRRIRGPSTATQVIRQDFAGY